MDEWTLHKHKMGNSKLSPNIDVSLSNVSFIVLLLLFHNSPIQLFGYAIITIECISFGV